MSGNDFADCWPPLSDTRTRSERLAALAEAEDRFLIDLSDERKRIGANGASLVNAPLHQFPGPVMLTLEELLAADFPPRVALLSPWLLSQSLTMVYAPRGIGKTHVALGIAWALASGGEFLGWQAPTPTAVAFLDGEMSGSGLQQRVQSIAKSADKQADPSLLRFMTPDSQPAGMPNLYLPAGQQQIDNVVGDAKVIIVDNISALVRGGKENDGESWQPVAEWALRQRSSGRSVLFIHHAGKGGQQRGTSKREDLLDTVISLRRPADYSPDQGARFEIHFEKGRDLHGEDVTPMEAALSTTPDGRQEWALRPVADASEAQMIELAELGLSAREIGSELGINHSTVVRRLKTAREEGRLKTEPKKAGRPKLSLVKTPAVCPRCAGEGCDWCGQ